MSERTVSIRPTVPADEDLLWLMLFYASHSNDEPGVAPEDIRSNPDLIGYIEGWRAAGYPGVVAGEEPSRVITVKCAEPAEMRGPPTKRRQG